MGKKPIVSIICEVYNHEEYLKECLESFVNQKTTFPIEILIHDDASTDKSALIIKDYERKYPTIIKPIYQKENQYSQGISIWKTYQFPRAKGKYIALCEGDDYWTDPYKLQKQVDFLASHPGYVMCSHCYQKYDENTNKYEEICPNVTSSLTFGLEQHINGYWYTQPLTCMFLRSALDMEHYSRYNYSKDFSFFYLLLSKGKGFLINEVMGVYRVHNGGVWSGVDNNKRLLGDLECIKGIYDADKTTLSALTLKLYMVRNCNKFGLLFVMKNCRKLLPFWKILIRHYGIRKTFIMIIHELHLKKIFVGYCF